MKCRKCGTPAAAPRPAIPGWLDPGPVMATTALKRTLFYLGSYDLAQVVSADPTRCALGFYKPTNIGCIENLSPYPDPNQSPMFDPRQAQFWWFDLFTYGALVVNEWYTQGNPNNGIYVLECYRTS